MHSRWLSALLVMALGCAEQGRTVGEVCRSVAELACARVAACDPLAPAQEACRAVSVRECCEKEGNCDRTPVATLEQVEVCEMDLRVWSCDAAHDGAVPRSCLAVDRAHEVHVPGPTPSPAPERSGTLSITWSVYAYSYHYGDYEEVLCSTVGGAQVELKVTSAAGDVVARSFDCVARAGLMVLAPGYYTITAQLLNGAGEVVSISTGANYLIAASQATRASFLLYPIR